MGKSKNPFWFDLAAKSRLEDAYTIMEEIGKGSSSIVYLAERKGTNQKFAVKILDKKTGKKLAQTEIGILLTINHANVIKLQDLFEDENQVFMVLEYVSGGELFDRIVERGYYSEKDAAHAVEDILEAVCYLHGKRIVHRDLKPENLLYSDRSDDAKLMVADFGLAQVNSKDFMRTICGTPGYTAPEVLKGKKYHEAVDMWAVGLITYILLCGYEPFYDERGNKQMFRKILKCDYQFDSPYWDDISENAKDFVKKLIVLNPNKRLSAMQALNHRWVKGQATNFIHMDKTLESMKLFNARRKVKSVFQLVTATTSMLAACKNHLSADDITTADDENKENSSDQQKQVSDEN